MTSDEHSVLFSLQNGKISCDEKPFKEPQFPRLPVSCACDVNMFIIIIIIKNV